MITPCSGKDLFFYSHTGYVFNEAAAMLPLDCCMSFLSFTQIGPYKEKIQIFDYAYKYSPFKGNRSKRGAFMKRLHIFMIFLASIFSLAILGTQAVWSKAHVPLNKVQMCHIAESASSDLGVALSINVNAMPGHMGHGDCRLPACDFNNVFGTGSPCDRPAGGGPCPLAFPRDSAEGITDACPPGTF